MAAEAGVVNANVWVVSLCSETSARALQQCRVWQTRAWKMPTDSPAAGAMLKQQRSLL